MDTVLTLLDQADSVEHVEKEQQGEEVEKELEEPLEPEEPEESLDEERTVLSDVIPSVFLQEQLANVMEQAPNFPAHFAEYLKSLQPTNTSLQTLFPVDETPEDTDYHNELVATSSSSRSPDLEKEQVAPVQPRKPMGQRGPSQRERKQRKSFPIENDIPKTKRPRKNKLKPQDVVIAELVAAEIKLDDNELDSNLATSQITTHDEKINFIDKFETKIEEQFGTLLKSLEEVIEKTLGEEFVATTGPVANLQKQVQKIRQEKDMWKDLIPYARCCLLRNRMNADHHAVMNRILSYYKTEHPDRFPGVLSNICTLFDKQERIVLKNMKSFLKENGRQSNSSSMVSDFNAPEITVERLEIGTQTTRIKTVSASTEMIPVSLTTIGVQVEPETMSQEIETEIEEGEKKSTEIVPAADLTSFAPVQNSPTLQSVNYSIVEQLASAHKKHAENTQILAKLFQSCLNQGTSEPGQKNQ